MLYLTFCNAKPYKLNIDSFYNKGIKGVAQAVPGISMTA